MTSPIKNILLSTVVLTVLTLYFLFDARIIPFPKCPFYTFLHMYCPGCGSQRALSAFLHGDFLQAVHNNALLVVFLPVFVAVFYLELRYNGQKRIPFLYNPRFTKLLLVVVIGFWIFRNIPFLPFSVLAPLH